MSALSSRRSAWLFSALWGGLAAIPFGLALYLTIVIAYVNTNFEYSASPLEEIGIFTKDPAHADLNAHVEYLYVEESTSFLKLTINGSAKVILNYVAGPDACSALFRIARPDSPPVKLLPLHKNGQPFSDAYLIHLKSNAGGPVVVTCTMKSIVERQSYTERYTHFFNIIHPINYEPLQGETGNFGAAVRWTLDLTDNNGWVSASALAVPSRF